MFYYIRKKQIFCSTQELDKNIVCDKVIKSEIIDGVMKDGVIISNTETPEYKEFIKKEQDFSKNEFLKTPEEQIEEINRETKEKILAKYSETDQANIVREVTIIIAKAQEENREYTEEEKQKIKEGQTLNDFISACLLEAKIRKDTIILI